MIILRALGINTDTLVINVPIDHLKLLAGEYKATNPPTKTEWNIKIEVQNGELFGNDRGYRYKLVAKGKNDFVNPNDGATLVFDTMEMNNISFVLMGEFMFVKIND